MLNTEYKTVKCYKVKIPNIQGRFQESNLIEVGDGVIVYAEEYIVRKGIEQDQKGTRIYIKEVPSHIDPKSYQKAVISKGSIILEHIDQVFYPLEFDGERKCPSCNKSFYYAGIIKGPYHNPKCKNCDPDPAWIEVCTLHDKKENIERIKIHPNEIWSFSNKYLSNYLEIIVWLRYDFGGNSESALIYQREQRSKHLEKLEFFHEQLDKTRILKTSIPRLIRSIEMYLTEIKNDFDKCSDKFVKETTTRLIKAETMLSCEIITYSHFEAAGKGTGYSKRTEGKFINNH